MCHEEHGSVGVMGGCYVDRGIIGPTMIIPCPGPRRLDGISLMSRCEMIYAGLALALGSTRDIISFRYICSGRSKG
jgi:hypothetical protein